MKALGNGRLQLQLKLLNPEGTAWKYYQLTVAMDSRLKDLTGPHTYEECQGYFKKNETTKVVEFHYKLGEDNEVLTKKADYYHYTHPYLGDPTKNYQLRISIGGGNLLFVRHKKAFYLNFRVNYLSNNRIPKLEALAAGDKVLCLDAGQKVDWAAVMLEAFEDEQGELRLRPCRFKPLYLNNNKKKRSKAKASTEGVMCQFISLPYGTRFRAIAAKEKQRSDKRSKLADVREKFFKRIKTPPKETTGGYLAKGQQSHVKLSRHIEHCRTLRYKQMASCVVKLALNNGVRFVALEDLQSYKTSIKCSCY